MSNYSFNHLASLLHKNTVSCHNYPTIKRDPAGNSSWNAPVEVVQRGSAARRSKCVSRFQSSPQSLHLIPEKDQREEKGTRTLQTSRKAPHQRSTKIEPFFFFFASSHAWKTVHISISSHTALYHIGTNKMFDICCAQQMINPMRQWLVLCASAVATSSHTVSTQ